MRIAYVLLPVAIGALVGCSGTPVSASDDVRSKSSAIALPLRAGEWETISDPSAFPLSNDGAGRLLFDFPVSGSMNYLYNVRPPSLISGIISVSIRVTTTGLVLFNYLTEPFNTCATPASVRPFI